VLCTPSRCRRLAPPLGPSPAPLEGTRGEVLIEKDEEGSLLGAEDEVTLLTLEAEAMDPTEDEDEEEVTQEARTPAAVPASQALLTDPSPHPQQKDAPENTSRLSWASRWVRRVESWSENPTQVAQGPPELEDEATDDDEELELELDEDASETPRVSTLRPGWRTRWKKPHVHCSDGEVEKEEPFQIAGFRCNLIRSRKDRMDL